ncbi:MAG: hypothetical protein IIA33_06850, partial [Planctomycetes bacterium]|nr:hypothetical protein [Planctomycetota bacterium]
GLNPSADNSLLLWDTATGAVIRRYDGHAATVWSLAFSPDGVLVASGSQDKSLILWDVETGAIRQRFDELGETPFTIAFSPDGSTVYAGLARPFGPRPLTPTLIAWDVESGEEIKNCH